MREAQEEWPAVMRGLREFLVERSAAIANERLASRRLYVTRSDAAWRRVANEGDIRRMLDGALASALPIRQSLLQEVCFGIVLRQQFGLRLSHFWELLFQHLRDVCMVLLSHTPH